LQVRDDLDVRELRLHQLAVQGQTGRHHEVHDQADKLACDGMKGKVCEGAPGGEVCACWTDDEGALIWDCDKAPTTGQQPRRRLNRACR